MPIYEYQCTRCGSRFEELVRSGGNGAPPPPCPSCGAREAEKLFSAFGVGGGAGAGEAEPAPFCGRCGENRPPCGAGP